MRVGRARSTKHVQGGAARHRGAHCRTCDKPLLLLWTIDTSDKRFARVATARRGPDANDARALSRFRKLSLLPIYYCWRCVGDLSYRLVSPKTIEIYKHHGQQQGEDFPYLDYPDSFPEVPLILEPIPAHLDARVRVRAVEDHWESDDEWRDLTRELGFKTTERWRLSTARQVGGLPPLLQGFELHTCQNPKCSHHNDDSSSEPMRILATIHETKDLPMITEDVSYACGVQVIAYICAVCHSLTVINRCD